MWQDPDMHRAGDHMWWISDVLKFKSHYPSWRMEYDLRGILEDIYWANLGRWGADYVCQKG